MNRVSEFQKREVSELEMQREKSKMEESKQHEIEDDDMAPLDFDDSCFDRLDAMKSHARRDVNDIVDEDEWEACVLDVWVNLCIIDFDFRLMLTEFQKYCDCLEI